MKRWLLAAVAAMLVAATLLTAPAARAAQDKDRKARFVERTLEKLGGSQARVAHALGEKQVRGKPIESSKSSGSPRAAIDTPVGSDPNFAENEPSIAANPTDEKKVLAASHYQPAAECIAYYSYDGGLTWNSILLPLLFSGDFCSDPVVRAAPDGAFFYVSYMSIRGDGSDSDIVVTRFNGAITFLDGPYTALTTPTAGDFLDKNWVDVHTHDPVGTDGGNFDRLYVTATNFRGDGLCDIWFAKSEDYGVTWSAPQTLGTSGGGCGSGTSPVVQGSRPVGGNGATVLVCWYNSESDGWLVGVFDIRCRTSSDNGATFAAQVAAVNNISHELPFWLCPSSAFHRVWGAMFPSITIAPDGSAHVAFSRDPTAGDADGECGEVRRAMSPAPPYGAGTWSGFSVAQPAGASFQGWASVVSQRRLEGSCVLSFFYANHQRSPSGNPNLLYDVYRRWSTDCGATVTGNTRVNEYPSMSDFTFIGDYFDQSATMRRVYGIWTDRADKTSIFDAEDDVFMDVWTISP